jgi:hypothetical protein
MGKRSNNRGQTSVVSSQNKIRNQRMAVPKLVGKVSDAFGFCVVMSVYGRLGCKKHDDHAELGMKRDFG